MSLRIKAVVDKFVEELKEALDADIQDRIMKEREMQSYIEEREREVAERESAWKADLSRREAHPTVKYYKDKVIVNWGDLATLCGTDMANGANATTGVESSLDFGVEEIPEEIDQTPSISRRKKKRKEGGALDMIAEAVSHIAKNMNNAIEIAPIGSPTRDMIVLMYKALSVMPELSEADLIKAIDIFSVNATKCEVFLVLPVITRRSWLRVQIGE